MAATGFGAETGFALAAGLAAAGLATAFTAGLAAGFAAGFLATAFAAGFAAALATGLAAAFGATALAGLGAVTGLTTAAALGAALAAVGLVLDFAAGLGLEAAVADFGDADLDADGDLAMDCPTPRLRRARECGHAIVSIRHDTGV